MDDAGSVRLGDRLARLKNIIHGLCDRQRPSGSEQLVEILACEVLHDQVGGTALQPGHVVDADDMLTPDTSEGAGLALEACDSIRVAGEHTAKELEGDALAEIEVARADDDAHTSGTQDGFDLVLASNDVARLW